MNVLPNAFAHRDDEHPRPLFDALDAGFRHVELDVWYLFGRLLVAHDPQDLRPRRTVRSLYLEPLVEALERGSVDGSVPIWIYIDVKTGPRGAHLATERLGQAYRAWVATAGQQDDERPIRFVLTGNRPAMSTLTATPSAVCHYDGRLRDLSSARDARWMPLISDDWTKFSRWRGEGPIPDADLAHLREVVAATRDAGQALRFWATPEQPGPARERVWSTLLEEGVTLLNTDDLQGLAQFLRSR